jgi:hypothetical protein
MDKRLHPSRLPTVFQSKPGNFYAKFNYFEQLYVTLNLMLMKRPPVRYAVFNFLLQFGLAVTVFSFW